MTYITNDSEYSEKADVLDVRMELDVLMEESYTRNVTPEFSVSPEASLMTDKGSSIK